MENFFVNFDAEEDGQINVVQFLKESQRIRQKQREKFYSGELPKELKELDKLVPVDAFAVLESYMEGYAHKGRAVLTVKRRFGNNCSMYIGDTGDDYELVPIKNIVENSIVFSSDYKASVAYISEDGTVWETYIELELPRGGIATHYHAGDYTNQIVDVTPLEALNIGKWRKAKLAGYKNILNPSRAKEIIARNQYLKDFVDETGIDTTAILIAPQIEQLYKAGYVFAKKFIACANTISQNFDRLSVSNRDAECFNRLTQPGKNLKEIFKMGKPIYQTLKEDSNLNRWDCYRKMYKQGKISKDTIQQVYDSGYNDKQIEQMSKILGKTYNNKPVFNWDSLQNYLARIDMYEAIETNEGLQLLVDYLSMCQQLDIKPRIDGDSLKREHDICARIFREKRDEVKAQKMKDIGKEHRAYRYDEQVFFGRYIEDYDDLLDEAKQQHNCVASYADKIIQKKAFICVVREKAHPEKSLATIELSTDCTRIRQKLLAYNQTIRNKALTEFIDRFQKHCREVYKQQKVAGKVKAA